jgi:hypothetical protein
VVALAVVPPQGQQERLENLDAEMAAEAVGTAMLEEQAAMAAQVVRLEAAAAAGAALIMLAVAVLQEQELEESAEYGPGSSEQCRTERPGCAEA